MSKENYFLGLFMVALVEVACAAPAPQSTMPSNLIFCKDDLAKRLIGLGIGIVPVPTAFPLANATTLPPKPTPITTASTCEASCEVRYPELFGLSWAREDQIIFTETVTVGTVGITTLTQFNRTSTVTNTYYNDEMPKYYTLYQQGIDDFGTKTVEAVVTLSDEAVPTIFAYPTPWVDYPAAYHWQGILPTYNEKSELCATATEELAYAEVTQHPLYPQPADVITDEKDPRGTNYVPVWIALQDLPDKKWFDQAFPSESAFAYCTSVAGKPAPVDISTAKFVMATALFATSMVNPGLVHQESSVTGFFDGITMSDSGNFVDPTQQRTSVHVEETTTPASPRRSTASGPGSIPSQVPDIPIIPSIGPPGIIRPPVWSTTPPVSNPGASHNGGGRPAPTSANNGGRPGPSPGPGVGASWPSPTHGDEIVQPAPGTALHLPTPIFTFKPTTINGRPTATPIFILPDSSSTATIGQTVSFNGQSTVLAAPSAIFAFVPTTINGIATTAPAFIISGTSTASIGQTITLNGQPTVFAAPAPFITELPTTIFGIETHVPAFIISGSITAFPGQTITLDGQTTVLPIAELVFTSITTSIDGKQTVLPVYVLSGSTTATVGQTVQIDGTTTVLSMPTADLAFTSITTLLDGRETVVPAYIISGSTTATIGQTVLLHGTSTVLSWPTQTESSAAALPTSAGQPQETISQKGVGSRGSATESYALLLIYVMIMIILL